MGIIKLNLGGKMAKYRISWWDEVQRELKVEAKNKKEAKNKFFSGELDLSSAEVIDETYIEDSVEVNNN
jgi:hypothetical protein